MRYKVSAICFAIIGVGAIPLSSLLFPFARKMSSYRMTDGTLVMLSPTAGTWMYKVGFIASGAFLLLAAAMFVISVRKNR